MNQQRQKGRPKSGASTNSATRAPWPAAPGPQWRHTFEPLILLHYALQTVYAWEFNSWLRKHW